MKLTDNQGFSLITAFLFGNVLSGIGGNGTGVKTGYLSVWISFGILVVFSLIFQSAIQNGRDPDIFAMTRRVFGKTGYRIFLILLIIYSFSSAFLSISNYMDFIDFSVTDGFPVTIGLGSILLLTVYFCQKEEKTMGRYAEITLPVVLGSVIVLLLLGIRECSGFTLPIPVSAPDFLLQGWQIFCSPFSEIIFLWILFGSFQNQQNIGKISRKAGFVTALFFSLVYLFNVNILGEKLLQLSRFPTFFSASLVEVGSVMEHAESFITLSYSFCDILYSSLCLLIGVKGIVKLPENRCKNSVKVKKITAFSAVIFMFFLYILLAAKVDLSEYYPLISLGFLPFTVGLPLLLLIFSKRSNQQNHQNKSS